MSTRSWQSGSAGWTAASDGPVLQRECACGGSCDECQKKELQRKADGTARGSGYAPPVVHDVLRSPGRPLDAATRAYMEPRFQHDFSRVRVHTGDMPARSAAAVGAEAYAVGRHIVFGQRGFSPESHHGRSLLAHELAHTLQQRAADVSDDPLPIGNADAPAEHDAHRAAESAAAGRPVTGPLQHSQQLARATRPFLLTFDDGPDGVNKLGIGKNLTEKVLDTLCEKQVKSGFFVQTAAEIGGKPGRGSSAIGSALIKRMDADGHLVGIHTGGRKDHESHPKAQKAGRLAGELGSAKSAISGLTGTTPTLVRPPYGSSNPAVRAEYKKLGLTNVLWDIDGDAGAKNLAGLQANISRDLKTVVNRGWKGTTPLAPTIVVLLHDIRPNTAKNVGPVIDFIKAETKAQTAGKDTADFATASCKTAQGAASELEGAGDYVLPSREMQVASADESGAMSEVEAS